MDCLYGIQTRGKGSNGGVPTQQCRLMSVVSGTPGRRLVGGYAACGFCLFDLTSYTRYTGDYNLHWVHLGLDFQIRISMKALLCFVYCGTFVFCVLWHFCVGGL